MILELYIFIECLAILFFIIGFFKRIVIAWAISLVLFGAQVLTSYTITNYIYYTTYSGVVATSTFVYSYPELSYINILFFAVTLIIGLSDLITNKSVGQNL